MLSNLWIRDFRAIQDLRLDGLAPVTLLTGDNNCGKTSALEAGWWLHGCWVGGISERISRFRGAPETSRPANDFFRNLDTSIPVQIEGVVNSGACRMKASLRPATHDAPDKPGFPIFISSSTRAPEELRVDYSFDRELSGTRSSESSTARHVYSEDRGAIESGPTLGLPMAIFYNSRGLFNTHEDIDRLSRLLQQGKGDVLISVLKCIDERTERVELIALNGAPTIFLHSQGQDRPMPLFAFGQGVCRAVSIALGMIDCRDGTLFVDEIENGIHYLRLGPFWDSMVRMAVEVGCQLIATTHSRECVQAAFRSASSQLQAGEKLSVFRMQRDNHRISAVRLSGDVLGQTLELDLPVV